MESVPTMFSREYRSGEASRATIFKALDRQRSESRLCDVTLVADGQRFPAHRSILAASSPYFSSMFERNGFTEGSAENTEVKMHCVSEHALRAILDMIYTGVLRINADYMDSILGAADHFLMEETVKLCVEYMRSVLRSGSEIAALHVIQIHRVSRLYNIDELRRESEKTISKNMARVLESPPFLEMELTEMLELLSADDIRDPDEVKFWRAALRWLMAEPETRKKHAVQVMEHVRFPLIDSRILVEHILPHPLIAEQEACRRLVLEAMQYQLLTTEQSRRQTPRTKPRYSRGSSAIIYCISGDRSFMCYIPAPHNCWYALQAPVPSSGDTQGQLQYNILAINGYVYALGQIRKSVEAANFQVECLQRYNIATNSWCSCAVPTHEKYVPTLLEADRKLLAVFRDVVMEYKPDGDVWDTLAEYNIGPFDLVVSNNNNTLDLYNLGEGLCHQVALNTRRQRRSKNQILTPSLFQTDLLDVTKLNHYEILLSMRASTGMTRKIFNARSEMWTDADLYQGPYSREPKPRTNFPQALSLNDLWVCLCDRPYSMLYVLGTRTGLADGGARRATGPTNGPADGILPFYSFDLEMHTWKRLVGFPEKLLTPYMKVCIDDGQPFMAVPESRVWPLFD